MREADDAVPADDEDAGKMPAVHDWLESQPRAGTDLAGWSTIATGIITAANYSRSDIPRTNPPCGRRTKK